MSQPFGWQGRQEVVHLCVLLKGFGYIRKKSTEIWKDSVSCIMMGETLTNPPTPSQPPFSDPRLLRYKKQQKLHRSHEGLTSYTRDGYFSRQSTQ
jgi:hypothetical protein